MDKLRYVLFMENTVAEEIAKLDKSTYTGAFVGVCEIDGLYPLSPMDIVKYVKQVPEVEHCAIVECFMPQSQLGLFRSLLTEDLISVNKYIMDGVYSPLRQIQKSCAFSAMTDVKKDELGWHHPMAGLTYLRNKQCMHPEYYKKMFERLAQSKGNIYVEYLEKYFHDMVLPHSIVEQYGL